MDTIALSIYLIFGALQMIVCAKAVFSDIKSRKKLLELEKELERKNQVIADCQCVLDDCEIIVEILEDNFIEEEINEMIEKKKELREKDLNKFLQGIVKDD